MTVGQDTLMKCPKCKLVLAHLVVAEVEGVPVQVRCNTCKSMRKLKKSPSSFKKETSFEPIPYDINKVFKLGDIVFHKAFGEGTVFACTMSDIKVKFEDKSRKLIHNK